MAAGTVSRRSRPARRVPGLPDRNWKSNGAIEVEELPTFPARNRPSWIATDMVRGPLAVVPGAPARGRRNGRKLPEVLGLTGLSCRVIWRVFRWRE